MGLEESWRIRRVSESGAAWTLVGLRFPDERSSDLVLSENPDSRPVELELAVPDVRQAYQELLRREDVTWIRPPFGTESGHVAVLEAPDGNVFVLVGG